MTLLCPPTAIKDGQARGITIGSLQVILVQRDGQVYAYENRCPHRGIPLEWLPDQFLDESGSLLQCATHGALFLIESGECVAGPCAGQGLRALPCVVRDGSIWLQNLDNCDD